MTVDTTHWEQSDNSVIPYQGMNPIIPLNDFNCDKANFPATPNEQLREALKDPSTIVRLKKARLTAGKPRKTR
ncbi:hypothetical protein D3C78_1864710 [compost metagenome]